jgi:hypothetical protein
VESPARFKVAYAALWCEILSVYAVRIQMPPICSVFCRQCDCRGEGRQYLKPKGKVEEILGDIGRSGVRSDPDSHRVSSRRPHFHHGCRVKRRDVILLFSLGKVSIRARYIYSLYKLLVESHKLFVNTSNLCYHTLSPVIMVVQLSYRKSLRWVPGEPSEPTSTLVLDVGSFFVDLRMFKADSSIDWAMAGRRTVLSSSPCKSNHTALHMQK